MTDLKPCPFCSEAPSLSGGIGTQYEIWCDGCGQSVASVQIADMMTIDERREDPFKNFRYKDKYVERAKFAAISQWNTRPPSKLAKVREAVYEYGVQRGGIAMRTCRDVLEIIQKVEGA